MLFGTVAPTLQMLFVYVGHMTSSFGPTGNLILEGDNSADHVELRVAANGHLIVQGVRGTRIDGAFVKDFGIVRQLPFDLYYGDLEVHTRGGKDQIWFDASVRPFVGNVVLDGGDESDTLRARGSFQGGLLVKGRAIEGYDGNDPEDVSGDVIELNHVTCTTVLCVAGVLGGHDTCSISDCWAGYVRFETDDANLRFDNNGWHGVYRGFGPGDSVTIVRTHAAVMFEVYCLEQSRGDEPVSNSVHLSNVGSGYIVLIQLGTDDAGSQTGRSKNECVMQNIDATVIIGLADKLRITKLTGEYLYPYGNFVMIEDSWIDADLYDSDREEAAFIGDQKTTSTQAPNEKTSQPRRTLRMRRVSVGNDLILRNNWSMLDAENVIARRDMEVTGEDVRLRHVHVGRDLSNLPPPSLFILVPTLSLNLFDVTVGGDLELVPNNGGGYSSDWPDFSIMLDSIKVEGVTNISFDESADLRLDNHLMIRNSRFRGLFTAEMRDGTDSVDLRNNFFQTKGNYVNGGNGRDSLISRRNTPAANIRFQNFEVSK